jgi:hypothetical protein
LPNFSDSQDDLFKNEILVTRVSDLEMTNQRNETQMKLLITKTDQLSLNFSKIDTENSKILKENKEMKQELAALKLTMKIKHESKTSTDEIETSIGKLFNKC